MAGDSNESVTIKAEMIDEVSGSAGKIGASVKEMATGIKDSADQAAEGVERLGVKIDETAKKAAQQAEAARVSVQDAMRQQEQQRRAIDSFFTNSGAVGNGSAGYKQSDLKDMLEKSKPPTQDETMQRTARQMREMSERTKHLKEGLSGMGDSITERVRYPMQQLSYLLEAGAAGMISFGLATESGIQKATLSLSAFTGSTGAGGAAFAALHSLEGPTSLGGLESAFEALTQAGTKQGQIMPILTALTNLSAVSLNPESSLASMSSAVASIQTTGLINNSDVTAFSGAGVNIWAQLSKETGVPEDQLRKTFAFGGSIAAPTSFMTDLQSSPDATKGLSAYRKTWAGEFGEMKKDAGDLLAVFETPLGNALTGAGKKISSWSTATSERFKEMGGSLGSDWSSNNMGAFGKTLAAIFGDPKLGPDITMIGTDLHALANIATKDVLPMARDFLTIATPAFQGFADVLGFLGQHRTTTELLLVTLGGFKVLSQIATWSEAAAKGLLAFTEAEELSGGAKATAGLQGLLGMEPGKPTSALAGTLFKGAGTAVGLGAAGYGAYSSYSGKGAMSDLGLVGSTAAGGALIGSVVPGIGTLAGAGIGALLGGGIDAYRHIEHKGGESQATTQINGGVHITVPGSGDPQKVANNIPKALNDQMKAINAMAVRRTGGNPGN